MTETEKIDQQVNALIAYCKSRRLHIDSIKAAKSLVYGRLLAAVRCNPEKHPDPDSEIEHANKVAEALWWKCHG